MRVTDKQTDRLWRIRETLTDYADIAALELAISALSHAAGQEVVVLNRLRPRNWTREMSVAWHTNIPDAAKAFDALIEAAVASSEGEG